MRIIGLAVGFFLLALGASPGAFAQATVEGTLTLGGKVVALPPGPWQVIHEGTVARRTTTLSTPVTLHQAMLVQEVQGRAAAVIFATAVTEIATVWPPHGICQDAAALRRDVRLAISGSLDCRGVVNLVSTIDGNAEEWARKLHDLGADRPGFIPPRWIAARILLSERMHLLNVEYRFAPSVFAAGAARTAANWSEAARTPDQTRFVDQVDRFGALAREQLERGLYGRAPSTPLPSPF